MGPINFTLTERHQMKRLLFTAASLDAAKRKLAEAEALEVAVGSSLPHKLHPSSFVRMGLEIEDQQCVVWLIPNEHSLTDLIQLILDNRSLSTYGQTANAQIRRRSRSNSEGMLS